jgi:hypothetical protein
MGSGTREVTKRPVDADHAEGQLPVLGRLLRVWSIILLSRTAVALKILL